MATGKKLTWVDDNQSISGTATGITIETDDTLQLNADTSVTMDAPSVVFTSTTTEKPLFEIVNATNDATGSHLRLANKRGSNNGANADVAGTLDFFTNDDAQNNQGFAEVKVVATAATSGSEQGTMTIGVACTDDGGIDTVLTIAGGTNAAGSITTVAGNLDVSSGVDVSGSITCSVDLDIEGDIDMATGKKLTWVDDNQSISGTATGITIETDDTLQLNADTSVTMDAPSVVFTSTTTEKPLFEIVNATNDATGSHLRLANKRGSNNGANADVAGTLDFFTNDDAQNNQGFAEVKVVATAATSGSEQGTMTIGVACTDDGGIDTVLTIAGGTDAAGSTTTVAGNLNVSGGSIIQGTTVETGGTGASITAAQIIHGYAYVGAAGGSVALTLPGADAIQTALSNIGITSAAGTRLPPLIVEVTDANDLTVTAGTGETVHGTAAINNKTAIIHYIFTGAATAVAIVTQA